MNEVINVGGGGVQPLYTYNYGALNTGQDVSYATGDDKWVRDNVFNPEIALWATDRPWVFPILDPNNSTLLLRGATPSGNNIFGNKERFTDTLGGQDYANNLVVDHYTGLSLEINNTVRNWQNQITNAPTDFHLGNNREYDSLFNFSVTAFLAYPPFNLVTTPTLFANDDNFYSSTTVKRDFNKAYLFVRAIDQTNNSAPETFDVGLVGKTKTNDRRCIYFKKAFTYDPLQDTEKLILS